MSIIKRGATYHLKRRVPVRFSSVEARDFLWATLNTDSEREAREKAPAVWKSAVAAWEAKLAGDTSDAEAQFEAARDLARARGFRYVPAHRASELSIDEIVRRVEAITVRNGNLDPIEARALLGTAPQPKITVSRALEIYWKVADDKTLGKSEDQVRRWKNPRIKAIGNFIEVVGNISLDEITADAMQDFHDWWLERIRSEGITANSANKDLTHLATVLRTVNKQKRLGLTLPLDGFAFSEAEKGQRLAFAEKWIAEHIVGNPRLGGLNTEARCILLGMVNTGYRPSEGASLGASQIRLDAEIPHISIEANGRALKTAYSARVIPLAGVSLDAFRLCPKGTPRYHDKAGLSATINKFMRENKMMETPEHSLYGLRHSFEDRMLDRDVDERIRRDLMGHALNRERYGKGASLQKLQTVIKSISL